MAEVDLRQNDAARNVASCHVTNDSVRRRRRAIGRAALDGIAHPRRRPRPPLDQKGRNYGTDRDDSRIPWSIFEPKPFGGSWLYRRSLWERLRDEAVKLPEPMRGLMLRRAEALRTCGQTIDVRQCEECDCARARSGRFTKTCKSRSCPVCSQTRASNIAAFLESAYDAVRPKDGYAWQFIVLTTKYDPADPADVEPVALRSRALLAAKLARKAWKVLGADGAAMLRTTEISARGMVHANLVYYGPPVDKAELDADLAAVDCQAGRCDVQILDSDPVLGEPGKRVRSDDPRGSKSAVKRAARYAAKGVAAKRAGKTTYGPTAPGEGWLGEQEMAVVIDPRLAVRWEIAAYRLQLTQRYGALRGLALDEDADPAPENDSETPCGGCGVVGRWKWARRDTEAWIRSCHDIGHGALQGSSWAPRARAGPRDEDE